MLRTGTYEYRGETQRLNIDPADTATIERLGDVFQYYMEHAFAESLRDAEVLAVEQPFEIELVPGVMFSGVIDLVLRRRFEGKVNNLVIEPWDHKTVGDVNAALRFLSLDVQMLSYETICAELLPSLFGDYPVEMVYNLIRRERPPGYGSRSAKTKSGARSTASTSQDDYLRTYRFAHSATELGHIRPELARTAAEAQMRLADPSLYAPRRPIKSGGEACLTSCAFFARCGADLVGHAAPVFTPPAVEGESD
jgi:hypothetical protein